MGYLAAFVFYYYNPAAAAAKNNGNEQHGDAIWLLPVLRVCVEFAASR
jgi:hypothetical protein